MIREYIIKISDEVMEDEFADRPHELVRCKDCKQVIESYNSDAMLCNRNGRYHDLNWFCADGERKSD